jgi:Ssp1 endopeptidase immunity protein Rap1a
MRLAALPLILILALFVTPAGNGSKPVSSDLPDIDTTRGFLEMCAAVDKNPTDQSQVELFRSSYCLGWMAGLSNGIHVAEAMHRMTEPNVIFCPPTGNSYGQMVHIVKKFIAVHPEMEHLSTGTIAGTALAEAFPCKASK